MVNIAVVDDLEKDSVLIETYIKKSGVDAVCTKFVNGETFLHSFSAMQYDLIFLDIYMDELDGVEVAKKIRETDKEVVIAFATTSLDFALEGYRVGALKYLEKPVKEVDIKEMLNFVQIRKKSRASISINLTGGKKENIFLDSILYFEQKGHIIIINTTDDIFQTSQSAKMDSIQSKLTSPPFLRCHRSYLVNLDYVENIDKEFQSFIMKNGDRADIKRGWLKKCEDALKLWILEKTKKTLR